MEHAAVTELPSGLVVDKAKMATLSAVDMAALFAQLYSPGQAKPVLIVESAGSFFTVRELLKQLDESGPNWGLICEKFGITISDEDRAALLRGNAVRAQIVAATKGLVAYTFAIVPAGWAVEDKISVKAGIVRRMLDAERGGYSIGLKTLERVWEGASKWWAKAEGAKRTVYDVRASGYNRTAEIGDYYVGIGCQRIERYELEQFALSQGWAFP